MIADDPGAMVSSWDSAGRTYGSTTFHADKLVGAADPTGGLLLAGEFDLTSPGFSPPDGKFIHAALMYSGGGAPPSARTRARSRSRPRARCSAQASRRSAVRC